MTTREALATVESPLKMFATQSREAAVLLVHIVTVVDEDVDVVVVVAPVVTSTDIAEVLQRMAPIVILQTNLSLQYLQ